MRDNIIKILIMIFLMLSMNVKADDNLETVEIGQNIMKNCLSRGIVYFLTRIETPLVQNFLILH